MVKHDAPPAISPHPPQAESHPLPHPPVPPPKSAASLAQESSTFREENAAAQRVVSSAHRLLSETGHDLQSPLMAVRESVRMVRDGYLGPLNDEQREALGGALQCCGDIEELIDNMLRLEHLSSGMPRIYREWIPPGAVADAVIATLHAAGVDQLVPVQWDMAITEHSLIYADREKLRRLLLNLLGNAIRATPRGGQVMVRTQPVQTYGTLRFDVIDRGPGISPAELQTLGNRGTSGGGGNGLGLVISRQMTALHFSDLKIKSRPRWGTCVSFEVPAAGPGAVADRWCHWREQRTKERPSPDERWRLDRPTAPPLRKPRAVPRTSSPAAPCDEVILSHESPPPQHPESFAAVSLQLATPGSSEIAAQMDRQLQEGLRMYELAYRAAERRWVMFWDADRSQALQRRASTQRSLAASLPAARFAWSDILHLPLGGRPARARVRDLMVRDTLSVASEIPWGDDRRMSSDLGVPTDVVNRRLDAELRHLTQRLDHQRHAIQSQAASLRVPPDFV
jgi:hypothetical protein